MARPTINRSSNPHGPYKSLRKSLDSQFRVAKFFLRESLPRRFALAPVIICARLWPIPVVGQGITARTGPVMKGRGTQLISIVVEHLI